MIGAVLGAKPACKLEPFVLKLRAWVPCPVFQHSVNCTAGDIPDRLPEAADWLIAIAAGYSAEHQQAGHAPHRVGSSAEAKQKNPIARFIVIDQEFVAIDNVGRYPAPGHGS